MTKKYSELSEIERRRLVMQVRSELEEYERTENLECVSQNEALCRLYGWTSHTVTRVLREGLTAEEVSHRRNLLSTYGKVRAQIEERDRNMPRGVDWDAARAHRDKRAGQVRMLLSEFKSRHPEWRIDVDAGPEHVGINLQCWIDPEVKTKRGTMFDDTVGHMVCVTVEREELDTLRNALAGIARRSKLRMKQQRGVSYRDNVPNFRLHPNYNDFQK